MSNYPYINAAIEHLRAHNGGERDPQTSSVVSKTVATLRGLIATHAKEKDTAMGIGPKEKHMRRMSGS